MNLRLCILFVLLFAATIASAQVWESVGQGVKLAEAGAEEISSQSVAKVHALVEYKGELYAGGLFGFAGGKKVNNLAKWNGKEWQPVGEGVQGGKIKSMCVYKDELYIGGNFTKAGSLSLMNLVRWDGTSFKEVGGGVDSDVQVLTVVNSDLYVGGDFSSAGTIPVKNIAKWDGAAWAALGHGTPNEVFSIAFLDGEVYAGGDLMVKDGEIYNNVFKWNGKRWAGVGSFNGAVNSLLLFGTKLCAGGYFGSVNDELLSFVAMYDSKVWHSIGNGIGSHTAEHQVSAMAVSGTELYVGGNFKTFIDGHKEANNIAVWDGTTWKNMGIGVNNAIYSMAFYKGQLFIGGSFTMAGEAVALGVACWKK